MKHEGMVIFDVAVAFACNVPGGRSTFNRENCHAMLGCDSALKRLPIITSFARFRLAVVHISTIESEVG